MAKLKDKTPRVFNFISGLPRSGSTLLSAILLQNPQFHAGMTSPVGNLFSTLISSVSAGSELAPMVSTEQRIRLSQGLFDSYYADLDERRTHVFDTNRAWTANLSAVTKMFPDTKMLCCVRDVAWVMDSLERQYQSNAFENTGLFNDHGSRSTVYSRTETLASRNGLVGYAWSALKEALYGPHADRLLIIDYDLLASRPGEVIPLVYDFIGADPFEHDFDNVIYDAPVFDAQLGLSGLHRVHKKVAPMPRRTILPPELFEQYSQLNFWRDLQGSRARIISETKTEETPLFSVA
ncbi:sulfotransferase family protein [Kordiimonas pumila]|uniref:Sulfotransferase family protein n=1 Tax=Kordiimonas pumila TaxID=2161677 RepID=A0ABV7D5W7_9PROT|nr:sulfotransferase [Kordiimonas pumila]